MLEAFLPLTFVDGAIAPEHLAKTLPKVILVLAFVSVATLPLENTLSMFHIGLEVSFILIALFTTIFLPFSKTLLQAIDKIARVRGPILPSVDTETMRLPLAILTLMKVSIRKMVCTLSMLERVYPLTFVFVPVFPLMNTVSFYLVVTPLSNV